MKRLKWLYPGMLVKRWIFTVILGVVLIAMGFSIVVSERVMSNRAFAGIIMVIGISFLITGIKRMINSVIAVYAPNKDRRLVDEVYAKRILEKGPRVVTIGGGHGLSTLLQGLKEYTSNITAIVTVADDGGSSGRLREEFNILPPGDIRNCLVALADEQHLMGRLFQFRFDEGKDLKGHNFGNLFIMAMSRVAGDFEKAVKESSKVLAIRGNVVPSSTEKVVLVAEKKNGVITEGESKIPETPGPVEKMYIKPKDCRPSKGAVEAIRKADVIVIGPGSLYTSIMPNLLIKGIAEEVQKAKAKKIYVCNVMTQHGETDGYRVSDHVKALVGAMGEGSVEFVIANSGKVPQYMLGKYREENAYPVELDSDNVKKLRCEIIRANIINTRDYVRHNSAKLAKIIIDLIPNIM